MRMRKSRIFKLCDSPVTARSVRLKSPHNIHLFYDILLYKITEKKYYLYKRRRMRSECNLKVERRIVLTSLIKGILHTYTEVRVENN